MKKRLLSVLLILCMALTLLPVGVLAEGEDSGTYSLDGSKVEEITKTATITGSGLADVSVTVDPTKELIWYKADNTIGRSFDGWWIGINVTAPSAVTSKNVSSAKYYNTNGSTISEEKNFSTNKDDGNSMQCWGGIPSENFLDAVFKGTGGNYTLTYTWYFNWDGNEKTGTEVTGTKGSKEAVTLKGIDQTVSLSFDLSKCQLLDKPKDTNATQGDGSEAQVWPRSVNFSITKDSKTTYYEKLADAVTAAASGDTITMLQNVEGDGIQILSSYKKTITIDFGGFTYTCNKPTGSNETQGVHLQKGNTVTLKNGTIAASASAKNIKALMQNYGNLTLEDMTLDGSNLEAGNIGGVVFPKTSSFTLNCYNGTVSLKNTKIINSKNGIPYSIGCGWWPGTKQSNGSYNWYPDGTQITIDEKSTFDNVLIYRDDAQQTTGAENANSTIKVGGKTYSLKYETADSPYYVEFTKSGNTLTPVLPSAEVKYTALADKGIVSDCIDKTMWVEFADKLPGNTWLWFDITNEANTTTYGIAAQAKSDGNTTKFAWSFQNEGQFEVWPTDVKGIESGKYTVTCYLLTGKVDGKPSKVPDGATELWKKYVTVADLTPATPDPVVDTSALGQLTDDQKTAVTTAAKNVELDKTAMDTLAGKAYVAAASALPEQNIVDKALSTAGVSVPADTTPNLVVQTYMDVAVKEYTPAKSGSTTATLTYELTPMYRVVATTESDPDKIQVYGDEGVTTANAAVVVDGKELEVTGSVEVTVGLPSGFVTKSTDATDYPNVFVSHKNYEYTANVTETGTSPNTALTATFTNPHGFSTFVITADSQAAAKIESISYMTLQAAVDAVENNGEIILLKDGEKATVNKVIKFTVKNENSNAFTATITAGSDVTMTEDNGTYTFVKKSTGGGNWGGGNWGGISTGNAITAPASTPNGKVSISSATAKQGDTVTVTVTPDSGYVLDTLTVTDAAGKAVTVTRTADGKYTFTMPATAVKVDAAFKKAALPFTDVANGAWYYDAVAYVNGKGLMNGTADTLFSPDMTTTRGMVVTLLYRLEGQPTAPAPGFTDVPDGQWYSKAIAWATVNKIVNGYGDGTFGPDDTMTREQLAAVLYRYAGYKGYDVSAKAGLAEFKDAAGVSAYARDAISWAVAKGLVNGVSADTLAPQGSASRAQLATILMRFCETVAK